MSSPKKINLLPKEGFEYSPLGRILSWSLSAGRIIVIFTELVVILAFLSRFWLDRRLTDLNEENNIKMARVQAQANFEKQFVGAQQRLSLYKTISDEQLLADKLVFTIASSLPAGVFIDQVNIDHEAFELRGESITEAGIAGAIKALETSENFSGVNMPDIHLDSDGQTLVFSLSGSVEKQ